MLRRFGDRGDWWSSDWRAECLNHLCELTARNLNKNSRDPASVPCSSTLANHSRNLITRRPFITADFLRVRGPTRYGLRATDVEAGRNRTSQCLGVLPGLKCGPAAGRLAADRNGIAPRCPPWQWPGRWPGPALPAPLLAAAHLSRLMAGSRPRRSSSPQPTCRKFPRPSCVPAPAKGRRSRHWNTAPPRPSNIGYRTLPGTSLGGYLLTPAARCAAETR